MFSSINVTIKWNLKERIEKIARLKSRDIMSESL
jgi:hypothetical protein